MITKEKLINLVKIEADNLKKFVSKEDLYKLEFYKLQSNNVYLCIYGQITVDRYSDKARYLIEKCCTVFISNIDIFNPYTVNLNTIKEDTVFTNRNFTTIECFISIDENKKNGNNFRLIEYLKGESDILVLIK